MTTPFLSVVTPTYNRSALLKTCFDSLCRQTDLDFEWIVIDDGSTDDTEALVRAFQADFPIYFHKQKNGGKHTALNAAHAYVHGSYVLILDSDDQLVSSAVEQVKSGWTQYQDDPEIGIVTFLKGESEDKPLCMAPDEGVPVDIMRYRRRCFYSSDCCEVIRAELFLQYPFPVFEGERFLAEGALWNRVSFTHQCVYFNKVIYLCEYLEGGLTKSGRGMRIRNPHGGMYHANLNMHSKNFFLRRVKNGLLYVCYGFFAKLSPRQILTRSCDNRGIKLLCLAPGYFMYLVWKKRYGGNLE